jgi:uncharacterized repeat protein (TIGR01451 family)
MCRIRLICAALCVCAPVSGQATLPTIDVKAIAEVEVTTSQDGHDVVVLAPADRVVPGDAVIYTLEIRNRGAADIVRPVISRAVPAHMVYVADSATGPGAEVTYSVDGGVTFGHPEGLRVMSSEGRSRRAVASDYTHIRWNLRMTLKSKSVAYARFRAVVK